MSRIVLQILERYSTDKEYELQKSHDKNPFHTLRYDFKPASVNSDEPASLELSSKGEVTIKAPNIAGSSSSHTVFRGQRRPHVKECLLVIDNRTGEMVLQKLTDNITVKATRTLGSNGAGNTSSSNSQATTTTQQHNSTPNSSGNGGVSSIKNSNNHLHANNNANSSGNNTSSKQNSHNHTANTDGPQLSEESSSSSDDDDDDDDDDSADDSSDSGSSSSSSSSGSNDEGFTF